MKSLFNYDSSFLDTSTINCSSFTEIIQDLKVNRIIEAIMIKKYTYTNINSLCLKPRQFNDDSNQDINPEYEENRETGTIKSNVFGLYFNNFCGILSPIVILALFFITQASFIFTDYWPLYWYRLLYIFSLFPQKLIKRFLKGKN